MTVAAMRLLHRGYVFCALHSMGPTDHAWYNDMYTIGGPIQTCENQCHRCRTLVY